MGNSFGRNLQCIFGVDSLFAGMNRPLASIELSDDKESIRFKFADGPDVVLGVEGDCCSSSWIEYLTVPDGIVGQTITAIEDLDMEHADNTEYLQVYQTKFSTPKGDIVLEYRNESNGYYGGYLVRKED